MQVSSLTNVNNVLTIALMCSSPFKVKFLILRKFAILYNSALKGLRAMTTRERQWYVCRHGDWHFANKIR
jgi:hypothetical protein